MSDSYALNINFNGKIRYKGTEETKDKIEQIILKKLNSAVQEVLLESNDIQARVEEGEFWNDEGSVKLGDLVFNVAHCPKQGISGACVDITPEPNTYGSGALTCRVAAYVSKHSAYLTVKDLNGTEKLLSKASMKNGQLMVSSMAVTEQNDDGAIPAVVVPVDNCVRHLH